MPKAGWSVSSPMSPSSNARSRRASRSPPSLRAAKSRFGLSFSLAASAANARPKRHIKTRLREAYPETMVKDWTSYLAGHYFNDLQSFLKAAVHDHHHLDERE